MSNAATNSKPAAPRWADASAAERLALVGLIATIVAAAWYLLPFWREQPELSHGYFALPCALALLWQSRHEADLAARWGRGLMLAVQWTLVLVGVAVSAVAALAALAQGPLHSQTAFLAGIAASLFLLSGILALRQSRGIWLRFNGASLAAAVLWCFVVPLPSGTLSRFTLFLQDLITAGSLRALHLFGFAAIRHGNVIQLPNTLVGVEEACSGIRSLTACLFAGVVLGGFMLTGVGRRVAIVIGAGVIAIVANFFRSTALCIMAARGVEINGFWHDATAYAVLGVTALILFAGCHFLSPKTVTSVAAPGDPSTAPAVRRLYSAHVIFSAALASLVLLVGLKIAPSPDHERPPPDLRALLVFDAPGWQGRSDEYVHDFSQALNTPHLRQESYRRGDTLITFYVAFWTADQSTLGSVALHTPEICLPGSGWDVHALPAPIARYPLAEPRRFAFEKESDPRYIWFWHFFNGRPMVEPTGLHPWQLAPALLKRGISAKAPQWVVRISSNKPLESLLDEPLMKEFFSRLRTAGLSASTSGD